MTPENAITSVCEMTDRLRGTMFYVGRAAASAFEQWEQLGRLGGQRADHAAALLGPVRDSLQALLAFASICIEQIDAMAANPFGEAQ